MKKIITALLGITIVWFLFLRQEHVVLGPGVFAPDAPQQRDIETAKGFSFKGYTITPLAEFHAKAKVLSRKDYSFGQEADLSPVDLALGWGRMSDESVLRFIDISQSGRWYRWRVDELPIPRREIETNSANMHLIPSDSSIEHILARVRTGDVIELKGSLVKIESSDGWRWHSSLTREDTGAGACELIFVDHFNILPL